jgi:hypothetical protein
LTDIDRLAIAPPSPSKCCRSSVVERILGKAEVVSSILTGSTISACRASGGCPKPEIVTMPE